jgi:hypothetical protein
MRFYHIYFTMPQRQTPVIYNPFFQAVTRLYFFFISHLTEKKAAGWMTQPTAETIFNSSRHT